MRTSFKFHFISRVLTRQYLREIREYRVLVFLEIPCNPIGDVWLYLLLWFKPRRNLPRMRWIMTFSTSNERYWRESSSVSIPSFGSEQRSHQCLTNHGRAFIDLQWFWIAGLSLDIAMFNSYKSQKLSMKLPLTYVDGLPVVWTFSGYNFKYLKTKS